jgi:anti-anti-sigma regulatory factor
MEIVFEQHGTTGIFNFNGTVTMGHESDLKNLLIKAIHSMDRAVLNFKNVTKIDEQCRNLLKTAYCTSLRLRNPLILTNVPKAYLPDLFNCNLQTDAVLSEPINLSSQKERNYVNCK